MLTDISNLGKNAGVEIKSFKRQQERIHDFYAEVPIAIVLEGEISRHCAVLRSDVEVAANREHGRDRNVGFRAIQEETRLSVSGTATTFRFVGKG